VHGSGIVSNAAPEPVRGWYDTPQPTWYALPSNANRSIRSLRGSNGTLSVRYATGSGPIEITT
jgi:hypothetical protein